MTIHQMSISWRNDTRSVCSYVDIRFSRQMAHDLRDRVRLWESVLRTTHPVCTQVELVQWLFLVVYVWSMPDNERGTVVG